MKVGTQMSDAFSDFELTADCLTALSRMKITVPTPIQKQALPLTLAGSDLIGIAQTGSGKTLVYALTILTRLQNDPAARSLVLTPSRETADQISKVFAELSKGLTISSCLIVAGAEEKKQVSQLKKNPRLIVATPGRLLAHLRNNKLLLQHLSILVVDEADRMLNEGFGPQLKDIRSTLRGDLQTLMLGASFPTVAENFAKGFLKKEKSVIRSADAGRPASNLKQVVVLAEPTQKKDQLFEALRTSTGQAIVFVNDQPSSESVCAHLSANGIAADVIHGSFKAGHRDRVIRDFRAKKFRVLVTTDLLARGLDVPDIALVINYDLPNDSEDFLHRIGRTARAGKGGTAVTFVTRAEEEHYQRLKTYLEKATS